MGNKEAKFKQAFEEIDTSKDHKVSAREFMIFMDPEICILNWLDPFWSKKNTIFDTFRTHINPF